MRQWSAGNRDELLENDSLKEQLSLDLRIVQRKRDKKKESQGSKAVRRDNKVPKGKRMKRRIMVIQVGRTSSTPRKITI